MKVAFERDGRTTDDGRTDGQTDDGRTNIRFWGASTQKALKGNKMTKLFWSFYKGTLKGISKKHSL